MDTIKPTAPDSPKARGIRVRHIRHKILGLSRNKLSNRHKDKGITISTLQNWEDGRYGGLTEKGAKKLVEAFASEGIQCNIQWLLYGLGDSPPEVRDFNLIVDNIAKPANELTSTSIKIASDEEAIAKELRFFRELHTDAMDAIVSDDGLVPYFEPGDYVAGIRLVGQEINKALGWYCIIQTHAGQVLIRKLEAGMQPGHYTLTCVNPQTSVEHKLVDMKLFSAAPIILLRKPLPILFKT